MGEYVKDDSSVRTNDVSDYKIISGHYHRHQTIGTVVYIGTPYTTSFSEANDGPKGIQILHSDGTLELIHTNLRKHVIVERSIEDALKPIDGLRSDDLLWLKIKGPSIELDKLSKKQLSKVIGHQNFNLDRIATDIAMHKSLVTYLTNDQLIDSIIDADDLSSKDKAHLKILWRELLK